MKKSLRHIPVERPPVFDLYDPVKRGEAHQYAKYHGYVIVWPHKNQAEATAFGRKTVRDIWNMIVDDMALKPDLLARLVAGGFTITDEASLDKFMGPLPKKFFTDLEKILGSNVYLHSGNPQRFKFLPHYVPPHTVTHTQLHTHCTTDMSYSTPPQNRIRRTGVERFLQPIGALDVEAKRSTR